MKRALFVLLLVTSCSGLKLCGGDPDKEKKFHLRMSGTPADARVIIDDRLIGSLGLVVAHGIALPMGQHRITIEKPGFFPMDKLVEPKAANETVQITVALVPIPE